MTRTREGEAHAARQRLDKSVTRLLLAGTRPAQLADYRAARDDLYSLATLDDAEFEATLDGAPDTREAVTAPRGVER